MDIISYAMGKKAGGTPVSLQDKEITITTNGETEITADEGYTGLSKVELTTNVQPDLESKSITISTNTTTTIRPTEGKDGLSSVEVTTSVPGIVPTGTINITSNNTYDVSNYASADVNVPSQKFAFVNGGAFSFSGDRSSSLQEEVDNIVANVDTSTIISMFSMFNSCTNITSLDLSGLNVSNVSSGQNTFYGCSNLATLNVTGWNASNLTYMYSMFYGCSSLTTLDLSSWHVTPTNVSSMFYNCTSLNHIDMRNFDFTSLTSSASYQYMFGRYAGGTVPYNCEIIVADNTQKQWLNTNFSSYTNVKTVAEYEGN